MLYQTLAFTIHGKITKNHIKLINLKYQLQHFDEFELPDGSYSVSDIQDYFKYIFKKHQTVTDSTSIVISVNKKENSITFKIKTCYYIELLMSRTMTLLAKALKVKMIKRSKMTSFRNYLSSISLL